jgi:tetratricopeptide (TPR) repeat protein
MRIRRDCVLLLAAVAAVGLAVPPLIPRAYAQAEKAWAGARVVAKTESAALMDGPKVVGRTDAFRIYKVEQTNGEWLWVVAEPVKGWIRSADVVRLEKAIPYFTTQIARNAHDISAFNMRGLLYMHGGSYDRAIADFTQIATLDPKNVSALYNRARACEAKQDFERALNDYTQVLRLDPSRTDVFRRRANAFREQQEYESALDDYNEALKLEPKNAALYRERGRVWTDRKEFERAIADLNEAIKLDPSNGANYHLRGNVYAEKDDYDKALADFTKAIELDPNESTFYVSRASALETKEMYERAISDYSDAIRLDPNNTALYAMRATAHSRVKHYADALADYEHGLRIAPNDVVALGGQAWLWATCADAKYRDGKKAVDSATRACELTDWKNPDLLDSLAASYAESGDFESAAKWEAKAIELLPDEASRTLFREHLKLFASGKPYRDTP